MREALAGGHPWAGLDVDEVLRRIRATGAADPGDGRAECSESLAALMTRALARNEKSRPQSADEFEQDLAGLVR